MDTSHSLNDVYAQMKFLWIFDNDAVWCLIPLTSALWSLGGSGFLFLRRFGIAVLFGLSALSLGVIWWAALLTSVLAGAALTLPYGDSVKAKIKGESYWLYLALVGFAWGLTILPVAICTHIGAFVFVMAIANGFLFSFLSEASQVLGRPVWKVVEIIMGASLGIIMRVALHG